MIKASFIKEHQRPVLRINPVDRDKVEALLSLPLKQFCQLGAPVLMRAKLASGLEIDVIQDGHHRYEAYLRRKMKPPVWIFLVEEYLSIIFKYFGGVSPDSTICALRYVQCGDKTAFDIGFRSHTLKS